MSRREDDLSKQNAANAPDDNVTLEVSPEDADTLLRMEEAGLIDLDGQAQIEEADPRLTEWTYEEFRQHMLAAQDLAESTTRERVKYVRYLETHGAAPVSLRPPVEDSWLEHVTHRRRHEDATGAALNHYRLALKSLLKSLGMTPWESLNSQYKETTNEWTLPPDDLVARFWTDVDHLRERTRSRYLAHTYAYIFHFGFNTGVRPPSEIVNLDVGDVDLENRRIIVTEDKKRGSRRILEDLPDFVMTANNAKSLRLYLEHWRPKVDDGSSDALFLNSQGERFNKTTLRNQLSKIGKTLWPDFKPYIMRKWFATQLWIATESVYVVAEKLGDKIATVEDHYLDRAKARSRMGKDHHPPRLREGGGSGE